MILEGKDLRNTKVKMFKGKLFEVEASVNTFLGEVDERGYDKHTLEFATSSIEGETILQAIFYSDD
jgi:hypothetical protein